MIGLGLLPESVGQALQQVGAFWFHGYLGPLNSAKDDPIWLAHIFEMGDEKPPTRFNYIFGGLTWSWKWSPGRKDSFTHSIHGTNGIFVYLTFTIKINQMKVDIPWMDPVVFYLHEKHIKINHPWESVNIPITPPNGTSDAWVKTQKLPGPPVVSPHRISGRKFPPNEPSPWTLGLNLPRGRLEPPYLSHHHLDWKAEDAEGIDEWTFGARGYFPWHFPFPWMRSYWYGWTPEILNNHRARWNGKGWVTHFFGGGPGNWKHK